MAVRFGQNSFDNLFAEMLVTLTTSYYGGGPESWPVVLTEVLEGMFAYVGRTGLQSFHPLKRLCLSARHSSAHSTGRSTRCIPRQDSRAICPDAQSLCRHTVPRARLFDVLDHVRFPYVRIQTA